MAGVCLWKTSGSILIVLLIELETKQFSLAFSKTRGMRQIVGGRDQDSRGGFPRQLAFPPRREQLFSPRSVTAYRACPQIEPKVMQGKMDVVRIMRHRRTVFVRLKTPESTRHPRLERVDDGYARDFLKVFLVFRDDNLDAMFEHARGNKSVPKRRTDTFDDLHRFHDCPGVSIDDHPS